MANRIGEILDASTVDQWRHVKGTLNPAHIGTRGVTVSQLLETEWLTGPPWLQEPPDTKLKPSVEPDDVETTCLNQTAESVIDWIKFNDFRKLLRLIVYCLRVRSRQKDSISVDEMEDAKLAALQLALKERFGELLK